ncbi:MAG: carbohydrate-binding family 9-like protein [Acidobacteria bacterium RIFCSPLOWO2_02_FULL_67_36]|nr:MAG: carbohydrate-binding family 9-like protein [Acidobacteria bacterium RIFCSPLOWO2_02_FULL_67_36]OFW19928.1 MAG: carbohydrate-binding family 9-like protein [Acidobacteria bacterium RIFCSPLOWO2_12_FULL_66_21]
MHAQAPQQPDFEALPFAPRHAICYRAPSPLTIDGKLDEPSWRAVPWSESFVDIQGDSRPRPRFATRMKLLWDDEYFYIAADMEEPDVWATLTARDSVIFRDNDFEVFIDPDGDTHGYYELEVNALKTAWDLMLLRPYRDGGPPIDAWDIAGLKVGADVRGTLNHPGDLDGGWTVELAMPWKVLREAAPEQKPPRAGDRWRVNFSRVEWQVDPRDGRYDKRTDRATGQLLAEDNWVWSPQGAIDMHMPERWGFVQFSAAPAGAGDDAFVDDPVEQIKWALRRLYYRQRAYRTAHGGHATDLAALDAGRIQAGKEPFRPVMQTTDSGYEISARSENGAVVHIRDDGRTWTSSEAR